MDFCGDVFASEVSKLSSLVITDFDFVHHLLLPDDLLKRKMHHRLLSSSPLMTLNYMPPPPHIDTPHSLKWHRSSASCTEFYYLRCQVSVPSLYFYRGKLFPLMALLTRRLSHPGLMRQRSEGNSSPKYFNCTSRSQHFPHNVPPQNEQLINHHTFRALLPLHFRLTISTIETLLRLCWCFHTATNFHI